MNKKKLRDNRRKKRKRLLSVHKTMEMLIKRKTEAEQKFEDILKELKIFFFFQKPIILKKKTYFVDFFITAQNLIFEIDGKYHDWKQTEDKRRENRIHVAKKFPVFRFKNEDILNEKNREEIKKRILFYIDNFGRQNNSKREITSFLKLRDEWDKKKLGKNSFLWNKNLDRKHTSEPRRISVNLD